MTDEELNSGPQPEQVEASSHKGLRILCAVLLVLFVGALVTAKLAIYPIQVALSDLNETVRVTPLSDGPAPPRLALEGTRAVLAARFEAAGIPARIELQGGVFEVSVRKQDLVWVERLRQPGRLRMQVLVPDTALKAEHRKLEIERIQAEKERGVYVRTDRYDVAVWRSGTDDAGQPVLLYCTSASGRPLYIDGTRISDAYPDRTFDGELAIGFDLQRKGARRMHELTSQNVGNQLGIVIDGELYSAPVIRSAISDGGLIVSRPAWSEDEARGLSAVLAGGELPFELEVDPAD